MGAPLYQSSLDTAQIRLKRLGHASGFNWPVGRVCSMLAEGFRISAISFKYSVTQSCPSQKLASC